MLTTAGSSSGATCGSPVLALSACSLALARTRRLDEVDDQQLAMLVRRRWVLSRAQGWAVVSTFGMTFAGGVGLAAVAGPGWMLGGFVAMVLSLSLGLGFAVEAGVWRAFRKMGRSIGLSEETCRYIYQRAAEADAWVDVVRACGTEPTDLQIGAFVRPSPETPTD